MKITFEPRRSIDSLFWVRVITSAYIPEKQPKFSLKPGNYVSEKIRKEFDDWLEKTFGYNATLIISDTKQMIFVHPNNMHLFKQIPEYRGSFNDDGIK